MDGQTGPENDAVGALVLSAEGRHFAYLAKQGERQLAVINCQAGPAYSGVGPLVLSHDGLHAAYVAWESEKYFVVADGRAGPPFNFISALGLSFSADGVHLIYPAWGDHKEGGNYDRKRWVVDGRALPQGGQPPIFSADGQHMVYVAEGASNATMQMVFDGQPGPEYPAVSNAQLSPDGRHVAFLAMTAEIISRFLTGGPVQNMTSLPGRFSALMAGVSPMKPARVRPALKNMEFTSPTFTLQNGFSKNQVNRARLGGCSKCCPPPFYPPPLSAVNTGPWQCAQ